MPILLQSFIDLGTVNEIYVIYRLGGPYSEKL